MALPFLYTFQSVIVNFRDYLILKMSENVGSELIESLPNKVLGITFIL